MRRVSETGSTGRLSGDRGRAAGRRAGAWRVRRNVAKRPASLTVEESSEEERKTKRRGQPSPQSARSPGCTCAGHLHARWSASGARAARFISMCQQGLLIQHTGEQRASLPPHRTSERRLRHHLEVETLSSSSSSPSSPSPASPASGSGLTPPAPAAPATPAPLPPACPCEGPAPLPCAAAATAPATAPAAFCAPPSPLYSGRRPTSGRTGPWGRGSRPR